MTLAPPRALARFLGRRRDHMEQTGTTSGQTAQANVDKSLETTLQRFSQAFNRFDVKDVASYFAEDATLITPTGNYGRGRDGVEHVFADDVQTILGGTTSRFSITGARRIGQDCVFLDCDHDLQNFHMPDGSTGAMKLHLVLLAQKKGDGWQWLDARPYGFLPPPRLH
jgi:uncharacterized protein (TIGR02246 family)